MMASQCFSALIDGLAHAPPMSGTFAYNSFMPGFPGAGGSHVDPLFGETVRQVTNVGCNANGTRCFFTDTGVLNIYDIYDAVTGAVKFSNQPRGNMQWHPTNPDKYQRFKTNQIVKRNLSTQSDQMVFTAPTNFDDSGGSLPWVDGSGDIYVFSRGGQSHVWWRSTNTVYSGAGANSTSNGGWVSITPDGNYVVTDAGSTVPPQKEHYAINHAATTLSMMPNQFWDLCGDHRVIASASKDKKYFISFDCNNNPGLYRIDITLNQAGQSETQQLQLELTQRIRRHLRHEQSDRLGCSRVNRNFGLALGAFTQIETPNGGIY